MLDPILLREQLDDVRKQLATRGDDLSSDLACLAKLDTERRSILPVLESARRVRKDVGEQVAKAKQSGQPAEDLIQASKEHGAAIKEHESRLEAVSYTHLTLPTKA